MKQIILNISVLLISLMVSIGTVKSQTTIFEQDGANNEFVFNEWDMGDCSYCFANTDKITIASGESGTLSINNTSKYKDIKVELHFDHALNNSTFTFDLDVEEPGSTLSETIVYADATTGNQYCYAKVDYNNSPAIKINKMMFSNPSESIKITYIKITGVMVTASLDSEELNIFDVSTSPEHLVIDSEMDGTLNVYNALGQVDGTYNISKGENTISNSTQGLMFLVFSSTDEKMVTRKKIMR